MHKRIIGITLLLSLSLLLTFALDALWGGTMLGLWVRRTIDAMGFYPDVFGLRYHPWGILTYPLVHYDVLPLLLNMLVLWVVGDLFVVYHGDKPILSIYLGGSILGAILYTMAISLLPLLGLQPIALPLFGSSAGVYALCFALGLSAPRLRISIPLLGQSNLLIIFLALYTFSTLLGGTNWGGGLAHLGGAIYGIVWGLAHRQGRRDYPTEWTEAIYSWIKRTTGNDIGDAPDRIIPDKQSDEELERILQKIRRSGYRSLSASERTYLQQPED